MRKCPFHGQSIFIIYTYMLYIYIYVRWKLTVLAFRFWKLIADPSKCTPAEIWFRLWPPTVSIHPTQDNPIKTNCYGNSWDINLRFNPLGNEITSIILSINKNNILASLKTKAFTFRNIQMCIIFNLQYTQGNLGRLNILCMNISYVLF